ncbi:MAG: pyridoxamine 5'-phosphate oxidase family protein [Proteobacteria bacterium]|nr:pyridoxamine 5'-phosphate oxidase family protein [Pseudomonadota bacterium]
MASRLERIIELLHATNDAALATHSQAMPGYPYASALPFVADHHHRPTFLISRLAEHTQNLGVDNRASLMLKKPGETTNIARVTLAGHVVPIESDPLLVARYLRYQPEAAQWIALPDFHFFRLEPQRIRVIGGFAQASWLDGERLHEAPSVALESEAELLATLAPKLPEDLTILGIDAYGVDFTQRGNRQRAAFTSGPVLASALAAAIRRKLGLPN